VVVVVVVLGSNEGCIYKREGNREWSDTSVQIVVMYAIKYQISVGSFFIFYFLFWGSISYFILDIYLKLQLEIDIT
jgi:hypothetical protein